MVANAATPLLHHAYRTSWMKRTANKLARRGAKNRKQHASDQLCASCEEFVRGWFQWASQSNDFATNQRSLEGNTESEEEDCACADPSGCLLLEASNASFGASFEHHATRKELIRSARAGCKLCRLIDADFDAGENPKQIQLLAFPTGVPGAFVIHAKDSTICGLRQSYFSQDLSYHKLQFSLTDLPFNRNRLHLESSGSNTPEAPNCHIGYVGRAIGLDPLSDPSLRLIFDWLEECSSQHSLCCRGEANLPTRVINVGLQDNMDDPFIQVSKAGESGKYVALTHCWGGEVPMKSLKSNIETRYRNLSFEGLPKTFRDAIIVTRKLGLKYLWIDAICIIQDSPEDWESESAKMGDVFGGSFLTISALSAQTSEAGFLEPRILGASVELPLYGPTSSSKVQIVPRRPLFSVVKMESPLHHRAWTLQERIRPTAVLHFSAGQMFWECRSGLLSEDGTRDSPDELESTLFVKGTEKPLKAWPIARFFSASSSDLMGELFDKGNLKGVFLGWYTILGMYTERKMTLETDKLPALAGLASKISAFAECTYVAGLWKEDIIRGLLWTPRWTDEDFSHGPLGHRSLEARKPLRAPSWSWASVDGFLDWRSRDTETAFEPLSLIIHVDTDSEKDALLGLNCRDNTIVIRGPLQCVTYTPPERHWHPGYFFSGKLSASVPGSSELFEMSGAVLDFDHGRGRECWCLALADLDPSGIFHLLLERDSSEDRFRRIGHCMARPDFYVGFEETMIVLV